MTEEETAASQAALENGRPDDGAIMQFIAAFLCGSGSGSSGTTAVSAVAADNLDPQSRQPPRTSAHEPAAMFSDTAVGSTHDTLHQLSLSKTQAAANVNGGSSTASGRQQGTSAADAVASRQFGWDGSFPSADDLPKCDTPQPRESLQQLKIS